MRSLSFLTPTFLRHSFYHTQSGKTKKLHYRRKGMIRAMTLPPQKTLLETGFPESVNLAREVLKDLPTKLSTEYKQALGTLLQTSRGSRGLFVALLSDDGIQVCDEPFHEGLRELLSSVENEEVVILAVKNVVMSSAMIETYSGRGESTLAEGSRRTSIRAINMLRILGGMDIARRMIKGLRLEEGEFKDFGKKWGYGEREILGAINGLVSALGEDVLQDGPDC